MIFWITFGVVAAGTLLFYVIFTFVCLEMFKMLLGSFFPLVLIILGVLGTIVVGLATPTEVVAMGSFGGFVLAAAYKQLNFTVVKESIFLTAKTSAMVCRLFIGSSIFAAAMIGGTVALVVFRGRVHIGYLAAIVAASNAGGAPSVVSGGDLSLKVDPAHATEGYGGLWRSQSPVMRLTVSSRDRSYYGVGRTIL